MVTINHLLTIKHIRPRSISSQLKPTVDWNYSSRLLFYHNFLEQWVSILRLHSSLRLVAILRFLETIRILVEPARSIDCSPSVGLKFHVRARGRDEIFRASQTSTERFDDRGGFVFFSEITAIPTNSTYFVS